jgi:hypothetical protein
MAISVTLVHFFLKKFFALDFFGVTKWGKFPPTEKKKKEKKKTLLVKLKIY